MDTPININLILKYLLSDIRGTNLLRKNYK